MVTLARRVDRIPFAPVVAALFGGVAAILIGVMPRGMLENAVALTGVAHWLPLATPPLGTKARALAVIIGFLAVALPLWLVVTPFSRWLDGRDRRQTPWRDSPQDDVEPVVMPTHAPRKPIFAGNELGAPLMSDAAIAGAQDLVLVPEDLAPFTSSSVPDMLLDTPLNANELAAAVRAPVDADSPIAALIARLEAGLSRLGGDAPPPGGLRLALAGWPGGIDAVAGGRVSPSANDDLPQSRLDAIRRWANRSK